MECPQQQPGWERTGTRWVPEPGTTALSRLRFRRGCCGRKGSSGWAKRKRSSAITWPPASSLQGRARALHGARRAPLEIWSHNHELLTARRGDPQTTARAIQRAPESQDRALQTCDHWSPALSCQGATNTQRCPCPALSPPPSAGLTGKAIWHSFATHSSLCCFSAAKRKLRSRVSRRKVAVPARGPPSPTGATLVQSLSRTTVRASRRVPARSAADGSLQSNTSSRATPCWLAG